MQVTREGIAWAAGLFEGEGCFTSIHWTGDIGARINLVMKLGMTDEDVVRRFAEIVGCGNVRHTPSHGKELKDSWHWYCGALRDIERLIEEFRPYLGSRRRARADELLSARRSYEQASAGKPHMERLVA